MRKTWALSIAILAVSIAGILNAGTAKASRQDQAISYSYDAPLQTFTVTTTANVAGLIPDLAISQFKADGSIVGNAPFCSSALVNGVFVTSCVFSGVVASTSISLDLNVSDLTSAGVVTGKTKVHCQKVAPNGCSGTDSVNLH